MKKIKIIAGVLALCAIAGVNVWNAATIMNESSLNIEDVENVAEGFEIIVQVKPDMSSGGSEKSEWYWSDFLPGSNWKSESQHIHCELYQESSSGRPIRKVQEFNIVTCGNGAGDCWYSDSNNCLYLMR